MPKFEKGQPPPKNAGRPKGSKNKKTLLKVDNYLAERGVHPVEEILKLMPELEPKDRLQAWQELLKYSDRQLKPSEAPLRDEPDINPMENLDTTKLMELAKC